MTVDIVILAMIAAFLGMRLYSVLGRRAEHEEEPIQGRFDAPVPPRGAGGGPLPGELGVIQGAQPRAERAAAQLAPSGMGLSPAIEGGLRDIAAADRRFDLTAFVDGAKGAYGMVLEAFWRGDKDELAQLCDRDVYENFVSAIDARVAAGETLENRLIRIEDVRLVSADFTAPLARIGLRFVADIAALTRDSDGRMVAGSLDDAIESRDVWTFSRDITAAAPDWLVDETDSEEVEGPGA